MWEWTVLRESDNKMTTNGNKRACNRWNYRLLLAEDTGLEPAGLLHLTRFPGELLSHSVNPPGIVLR